ncbi:histidinol dehydrogenase [Frigoribacterium sp. 9N]|uniref:histidinol dehydrogenase n=1 Tax=Frigoribacterium sp. 9N TaxID=2653144 RepID=UPI0012F13446|nr:histidinol dehydrogenase [Frigoribacterium sp. 9N]VXB43684.1 Histidinol dehydrogenase [Frigoribacterium sp. 9N]
MIQTTDLRGLAPTHAQLLDLVPRSHADVGAATDAARRLVDDVRERGAAALRDQAARFDGVRPDALRVTTQTIDEAVAALDPLVKEALVESIARVTQASRAQVPAPTTTRPAAGATIEQRWQPVTRAGVYVPGGKAVYPSSVVMNVVPAQVAGVSSIALVSPAQREHGGGVHPVILGAAGLLGIDEVYAIGGAGAIGALAYGVPELELEPVQVITGPGNNFVAAAKQLVRGRVGIDSVAGATEILVIADDSADATLVAVDLISQAEHDEEASAVLVTDSARFAEAVVSELTRLVPRTLSAARVRTALSGRQSAVVLVDDLRQAAAFSNAYGPEHLEVQTRDDDAVLADITDAGAIFVGPDTPVSLGDYLAGSNHVLPTSGQSRFSSGLGAFTFLRPQQIVRYDAEALGAVAERLVALSNAELLPAHGEAVAARLSRP